MLGDEILKYRDEIVFHTRELIKIRSVEGSPEKGNPFGRAAGDALRYILDLGKSMGFETRDVDGYAGHVEYGEGDEISAVLVHLDVVPEGDGWTFPPYEGVVSDGKIYGRGAVDDKGPAVVALYSLKVLKDMGVKTKRRIRVIFGTNEESGMKDMEHYFSVEPLPVMGFSPDASYPIFNREKGIMKIELYTSQADKACRLLELKGGTVANVVPGHCECILENSASKENDFDKLKNTLEGHEMSERISLNTKGDTIKVSFKGKPSHGAKPDNGINAISHLLDYISSSGVIDSNLLGLLPGFLIDNIGLDTSGEKMGISCSDEASGELTLNLGVVEYKEGTGKAVLDIRYPVTVFGDDIIKKIKERAKKAEINAEVSDHKLPLYVKEDHPLIQKLKKAYRDIKGEEAELVSMGGGTYARALKNNGVAFGGPEGENVHQADEYVSIDGLMQHARICTQAVYEISV